jgi:divalent metal cation (Fe/Co/Zn/Cd) transporter
MSAEETTGTVVVALAANLVIALAKIGAGVLSGSSAMLAEGAHSVADTTNQVFLLAAIAVGLLLCYVAFVLGRDTKELLIGEAAEPAVRRALYEALASYPEVSGVLEVLTMWLGPDSLLVAAKVDVVDTVSGGELDEATARIEADLRRRFPAITELFLHVTSSELAAPDQVAASAPVDSRTSSVPPSSTR